MTPLDRRLAEFVDRTSEMSRFCEILGSRDKPIVFVVGDSGIGKSSLLARMLHECSVRKLTTARIEWTETRNPDYLAIMRGLRDDLGAGHFSSFTALVNAYFDNRAKVDLSLSSTGDIRVGDGLQARDATIGDIAGVVIRDCMFVVPRSDLGVSENERMLRLTESFLADLAGLAQGGPMVIFFDAVQKMTDETRKWMWDEFMGAIRDDRLPNVISVHFGQVEPTLDRDMRQMTELTKLGPLSLPDIEEYLAKRGIACTAPRELAMMVLGISRGRPIDVANAVDWYEQEQTKQQAGR